MKGFVLTKEDETKFCEIETALAREEILNAIEKLNE